MKRVRPGGYEGREVYIIMKKYPYFIKTTDGYIGRFLRLDWSGDPLYQFDGGNYRNADRWELEHGSDDRAELEV